MLLCVGATTFMSGTAYAAGTAAGVTVSNSFTLDYTVGTVQQPQVSNPSPVTFTVDRLVDLTVTSSGETVVSPGAQDQNLIFTLTNNGNDTQAYLLSLIDESGDAFSATTKKIFYYKQGDAQNTAVEFSGKTVDVLADETYIVYIEADIPTGLQDEDVDSLTLLADTLEPSSEGASVTPVVADTDGNDTNGDAENILADGSGTSNENVGEGDHSATSQYKVASADLTAVKALSIFSQDGANCSTIPGTPAVGDQYSIPGACIEYTITVENRGGTSATALTVNDILPSEITFIAASATGFTGGSFASPALPATNTDCISNACEINYENATLAGGSDATPTQGTITIRALIK